MGKLTDQLRDACAGHPFKFVGFRGDPRAPVWVVGEAPGADEDQYGVPFVGASGKEQDRMLQEAGFSANDVCFTNVYKVRPPDNDLARLPEIPIPDIVNLCQQQFLEELNEYKPRILICAGGTSTGFLLPDTISKKTGEASISKWRGSIVSSPKLGWEHYCIPVYHPAFVLREWAERQVSVLCYTKAFEEFAYYRKNGRIQPLPDRQLIVQPGADDACDFLRNIIDKRLRISNDIEMIGGRHPYTIAIATSPFLGMSLSLWDYEPHHLAKIWRLLDAALRTCPQIGQNYLGFDCCWLESLGLRPAAHLVSDTLIRHHILWPEFEHKLQFQTFQYTREPYYKDEGRLWSPKEGKPRLMRYNAKDSCVTFEIHDLQDTELEDRGLTEFYEKYQKRLNEKFHWIEKRGLATDPSALGELSDHIVAELGKACASISVATNRPVSTDKESCHRLAASLGCGDESVVNLSAPKQVLDLLKGAGLKIPKKRGTGKESSDAETLNTLHASTGSPIVKSILDVRELNKIKGTYVNAKLADGILYCSYVVTGTVTGRRSSRANIFGLGTNHQNLPIHSVLGKKFSKCLVSRPGHIFVSVDQEKAEDWIVQGLIVDNGGPRIGLDELLHHVDRHKKLAAFIFSRPEADCDKNAGHEGGMFYYLGKKTRHAANYDMHGFRMSEALTAEGFSISATICDDLLCKFHEYEPAIRGVFHEYIKLQLNTKRYLRTPLGRDRYFMSLRPYSNNEKIYKEGYAYIPQSTIGDNTGLAIIYIEDNYPGHVVLERHDSVTLEVPLDESEIIHAIAVLRESFNRTLTFPNGTQVQIPVEAEIGFNLKDKVKCPDNLNMDGLRNILTGLQNSPIVPQITTSGAPSQLSAPL
jgi:uracil-DNA glycosylase